MRFFTKRTMIIIAASVFILLVSIWGFSSLTTSADPLTKDDASKLVKEIYGGKGGKVIDVSEERELYHITVQSKAGLYDVSVQRKTGEIIGIEKKDTDQKEKILSEKEIRELISSQYNGEINKVEKKTEAGKDYYFAEVDNGTDEVVLKMDPLSGEVVNTYKNKKTPEKGSALGITEQEAINIALKEVNGEVDDVDLEEENGLYYYLIEIEQNNDQEAVVQINAITGEVITVTWDD